MNDWSEVARGQSDKSQNSTNVMRFFGQMLRMPLAAFVYSIEIFVRTMRGMQRVADEGINLMVGGLSRSDVLLAKDGDSSFRGREECCGGVINDTTRQSRQKEEEEMWDRESWENDLKVVRYWVLFEKRDFEEIFSSEEVEPELSRKDGVELVLGRQSIEEFRGEKRSKFRERLKNIRRPEKWKDRQYPPDVKGDFIEKLPKGDFDDYTRIIVDVLHQQARRDRDYEKDKVDLLGGIKSSINRVGEDISSKIG